MSIRQMTEDWWTVTGAAGTVNVYHMMDEVYGSTYDVYQDSRYLFASGNLDEALEFADGHVNGQFEENQDWEYV